jgi:hypothetical protein
VLAFRFPLAQLWHPRTYQISAHVRAERAAIAMVPPGTTVESTLTTLAPLATRDSTFWIGTPGNPVRATSCTTPPTAATRTRPPTSLASSTSAIPA